ncbi:hypothetical protein J2Y45_001098 [Dyadobacter sp. BE34]|uniref:Uncharacterized protein n=1 Tax=Dyadobacter fermentans TaxID=94254 RepID=A0ABU1QT29_9BACT|nr:MULTISPECIES: hypothetical protein [Dyadobacter]MDR6803829.1 hypothetical protein [Dyadobacter fermentans]MDR7041569.1 hypothetical protein [Dyadobacter sp. BE242]MDR7195972.1 hypothetical protein [Dyadobacter sp. BE34]MDR7213483.1 hypothetical protein [Dyadobacter sp. BE31]MDR7261378.1 hypothetical protein [Dyadobacter sp. BE32]
MEPVRKIIVPTTDSYMLNLPKEMVGKQIEVTAVEVSPTNPTDIDTRMQKLNDSLSKLKVDLTNWKFDRNEANNYD